MKFYELSLDADKDLEDIYIYTIQTFGEQQAIIYLETIEAVLSEICTNPEIGRVRTEVRAELRSISCLSHIIFYRILTDRIRVLRVLHQSREMPRYN